MHPEKKWQKLILMLPFTRGVTLMLPNPPIGLSNILMVALSIPLLSLLQFLGGLYLPSGKHNYKKLWNNMEHQHF
jgi:hypothetical protein